MKVVLFGTGDYAKNLYPKIENNHLGVDIVGFCDNNSDNWGEFLGKKVFAPYELNSLEVDKIIILSHKYYDEIKKDLLFWHRIPDDKIENIYYLLKVLMKSKYKNSKDVEIIETLKYWENHDLTVFNQFVKDEGYSIVNWDNIENLPYIILEDKKLYFPYDMRFETFEGNKIVRNVMQEQQKTSPHLYIKEDISVNCGDIIADVGVAEGDFSIRFVEKASKIYLFEGDKRWHNPLQNTFKKFKEKVVFIDKFVGKVDEGNVIRLDTAIDEKVDFLKMDIEGAECDALLGARNLFKNSDVKCAICSYHRAHDEDDIKDILHAYEYDTNTSDGYMCFYHDINIFSSLDFRHGIVYGRKRKG